MKNDLHICIPTSNRSLAIGTHKSIPESWKPFTSFYIPRQQVVQYTRVLKGWHVVPVPKELRYIACQRQWIMENRPARFVLFLDDDLSFSWRDEKLKLHKCDADDMERMLAEIRKHLKQVPVVSISPRFGNNYCEKDFDYNCRAHTAWAIDGQLYDKLELCFNPLGNKPFVMEDFHIALRFLECGYKNVRLFNFAFNPLLESNAAGGCSSWRTFEVHDDVTKWMEKNHPAFTRVFKTSKTGWEGFPVNKDGERERWDANIQWKKAYRPKVDSSKGVMSFLKGAK